jgi:putative ABC transport system permease protein
MGTYGVVTYGVSRRYREFGVRIALGADRGQVVGVVLRRGFVLAALGLGLGTAGAFAVGPALQGLLFGVGARDALALAAGPLVMGAAVVIASMLPALRASRVDPLEAFREDA